MENITCNSNLLTAKLIIIYSEITEHLIKIGIPQSAYI
jgi:hypothetical protein